MKTQLIITHAGRFHADEVFAIALLRKIYPANNIERIKRKDNSLTKYVQNPNIIVVDVGDEYDPTKLNFDHHQVGGPDKSALGLVWEHFGEKILSNPNERRAVYNRLVKGIDMADLGMLGEHERFSKILNISKIIQDFNRLDRHYKTTEEITQNSQFYAALDLASIIWENCFESARKYVEGIKAWKEREVVEQGLVGILKTKSPGYRDSNNRLKKPHLFVITGPGNKGKLWNVFSPFNRDFPLRKEQIPEEVLYEYIAKKGHTVSCYSREDAVKIAKAHLSTYQNGELTDSQRKNRIRQKDS